MRPPSTLPPGSRGFLRATAPAVVVGSPLGPPTLLKGGMSHVSQSTYQR